MATRFGQVCKHLSTYFHPKYIVQSSDPTKLHETSELGKRFMATTLDAMPARIEAAREEWKFVKEKLKNVQDFTVEDAKYSAHILLQIVGCYQLGKIVASRQLGQGLS